MFKLKFKQLSKKKLVKLKFFNTRSYPKRSQKEWKLIDKNPFGDADRDRVPNWFDCKPLNKKKHGKFTHNIPVEKAKYLAFYHGTDKASADKILKEGLKRSDISRHRSIGGGEKITYGQKRIYITPNPYIAIDYSKAAGSTIEEGRVLKVNVPIKLIHNQLKKEKTDKEQIEAHKRTQKARVENIRKAIKEDWAEYILYEDVPKEAIEVIPKEEYKKLRLKAEKRDIKRYGERDAFKEQPETLQVLDSEEIKPIEIKEED